MFSHVLALAFLFLHINPTSAHKGPVLEPLFALIPNLQHSRTNMPLYTSFKYLKNTVSLNKVSTWALIQYDNRHLSSKSRVSELLHRNRKYCEMHNYSYYLFKESNEDLPVYWQKVSITKYLLSLTLSDATTPAFKGILWLDTDAVVWNYVDFTLTALMPLNASFAYAPDPEGIDTPSPFNAGVWIVRNSKRGRSIMKHWLSLYDPQQWYLSENGKWVSRGTTWAGDEYEQGSFTNYMLGAKGLLRLPWHTLHGIPQMTENKSFIFHFCGLANALTTGLVKVDMTIIELLRIKYEQSLKAQMHRTYMQFLAVNFGVALLRMGIETNSYDLFKESEGILLRELEEDPHYDLCRDNLRVVQDYIRAHHKHDL